MFQFIASLSSLTVQTGQVSRSLLLRALMKTEQFQQFSRKSPFISKNRFMFRAYKLQKFNHTSEFASGGLTKKSTITAVFSLINAQLWKLFNFVINIFWK